MMFPSLSPLSGDVLAGGVVDVPAPPRFKGVSGRIRNVTLETSSRPNRGTTASQKAGLRYEDKALNFLEEKYPSLIRGPTLRFHDDSGRRICIPDGLLLLEKRVIIFEIKLQHMPEAWWQLKRLYEPVVSAMYPKKEVQLVEVARSVDPSTPFPCVIELILDLDKFIRESNIAFGVFHWKP